MFPYQTRLAVLTSVILLTCGAFLASSRNALGAANDTPTPTATATATATTTPTPSTRLGNISTRALVESDQNVLIAGFIVTGTQDKKVIIRGLGPAVSLPGRLADPMLELWDSNQTVLGANDDWKVKSDGSSQQAEIEATGIPPKNDLESALVKTLTPGAYTVILKGFEGGTGIGVAEVYDLDPNDSKLANISTRGLVSTGDNVMVAGTFVSGTKAQDVIIRAIGPSLSLPGNLRDPTLQLVDANGRLIDENDNWEDNPNKKAVVNGGLQPSDRLESVIVTTLPANNASYTVIVHGIVPAGKAGPPMVSQSRSGSGTTVEIQRVQLPRDPLGGTFNLFFTLPSSIVAGQPGDKAALKGTITIPWNATADEIKAAIIAAPKFLKYDQNNHLTAGPDEFHALFDSGGGLGIAGNEGSRREPVVVGTASDFSIQFGTLTVGSVGTRNPWIIGLPLVQVDDSGIIYGDTGIGVVEVYALP